MPANFLDVGGSVNKESVSEAFKIILSDKKVKAILINIFGGIVKCDVVAEGIIKAVEEVGVNIPVIVRLKGNNSEKAQILLETSSLNIISESDLSKAALKAANTLGPPTSAAVWVISNVLNPAPCPKRIVVLVINLLTELIPG